MKRFIKNVVLLLALLVFAGVIFACTSGEKEQPDTTEEETDIVYTVVHPEAATEGELAACEAIRKHAEKAGAEITVTSDLSAETKHEILVGKTNRKASNNELKGIDGSDFTVAAIVDCKSGYKVVVVAASDIGMDFAVDYFLSKAPMEETFIMIPKDLNHTYKCADPVIAGTPLSEYTVVYANEGVTSDKRIDASKYVYTVENFVELVKQTTGKTIAVTNDTGSLPSGKVIFFGNNSSDADDAAYSVKINKLGSYQINILDNGNIVLAGKNAASTLAAGEAFLAAVRDDAKQLVPGFELRGKKKMIRVACVGDSITYGTGSTDDSMYNYPVYLQKLLGYDYYVEKYGAPANSLIETDDFAYINSDGFNKSRQAAPDVVIIMLGTNDCHYKADDSSYRDWTDPARPAAFIKAGQKLIDAYKRANPNVQIIFATPPFVRSNSTWSMRIKTYCAPTIRELAEMNGYQTIDIYSYSRENTDMFRGGDGLHPKDEGYAILAQGFYELTKDIIKKP